MLAHLPALLVYQQAHAHHVLVGGLAEHQRPDRHQRIEPTAGLVDCLADELRRVTALELLVVPQRRAELRERHRTRVVPDVDDLWYPARSSTAVGAGNHHIVDERPVRVDAGQIASGELR